MDVLKHEKNEFSFNTSLFSGTVGTAVMQPGTSVECNKKCLGIAVEGTLH